MNLGIDFGSTYTTVSRYRKDHNRLEVYERSDGGTLFPSVIALDTNDEMEDNILIGSDAKKLTGEEGYRVYKAFKMLLSDADQNVANSREYDNQHTPRWAAEKFFRSIVDEVSDRLGDSVIENLVVGAPDVWFQNFGPLSSRSVVHDICMDIDSIKEVRIVREPVLASAYFAHNYQLLKGGKPLEAAILIIDYGGGTLDLSLTKVQKGTGDAYEIKMLASNGAGENVDKRVGNAGIVYMESLMEDVIRKNQPDDAEALIGTPDFYAAVNQLESLIKKKHGSGKDSIDEIIRSNLFAELDDFEEVTVNNEKNKIRCGKYMFDITFADLIRTYDRVIRPVLAEKLDEMLQYAKDEGVDVHKIHGDDFKIAIVGGFGNFYLVRQQIYDTIKVAVDGRDDHEEGIIANEMDRERAISYGAALIASGVFNICTTAPYSVGICSSQNGVEKTDYMVHYLDEIELKTARYVIDEENHIDDELNKKIFYLGKDWSENFVIETGNKSGSRSIRFRAKDAFKQQLEDTIDSRIKRCGIGASFTESDILCLHILEYNKKLKQWNDSEELFEIGLFDEFFEENK